MVVVTALSWTLMDSIVRATLVNDVLALAALSTGECGHDGHDNFE